MSTVVIEIMLNSITSTGEFYIVCLFCDAFPNGRVAKVCKTFSEANYLIRMQKEHLYSLSDWKILHVVSSEWMSYIPTPMEQRLEDLYSEEEDEPYWNK